MAELCLPPATTPISDARGFTPLPWRRYFEGVYRRLGGAADIVAFAYRAAQEAAAAGSLAGVAAVADGAYEALALAASFPSAVAITGVAASGVAMISGHRRHYQVGAPPVDVTGGVTVALDYDADYWLFYDQPSRVGGLVYYQATKTYTSAFPSHDTPHRHFVGALRTPASSGASNTTGKSALPQGYVAP